MSEDLEQPKKEGEDFVAPETSQMNKHGVYEDTGETFFQRKLKENFNEDQQVSIKTLQSRIESSGIDDEDYTNLLNRIDVFIAFGFPEKTEEFCEDVDSRIKAKLDNKLA